MDLKAEFSQLVQEAQHNNWIAQATKWLATTLIFGIVGAFLFPYVFNGILNYAGMEQRAGALAGFLIAASIANMDKMKKFSFFVVVAIVVYMVVDLNMIEAIKTIVNQFLVTTTE